LILLDPILNVLIVISHVLFNNFGLAIIALTAIVRLAILPLTLKQLRASKKMSDGMRELQPKLQQIQKKYAKDKQKLFKEQQALFKEAGINPMGCLTSPMLVTTLIQMPVFIAVYRAIIQAVAVTPQDFLGLSGHLYSWSVVRQALPVSGKFLWLNLSSPDPYFLIPLLVMATMWVSQKMMTQSSSFDPKQQSMQNMMQIMMPLMFGFITLTLPSGLGLYFLITSVISIIVQYRIYGWGNLGLGNLFKRSQAKQVPGKK
jgi:YidC/Oxa1 family membrane protein insertase